MDRVSSCAMSVSNLRQRKSEAWFVGFGGLAMVDLPVRRLRRLVGVCPRQALSPSSSGDAAVQPTSTDEYRLEISFWSEVYFTF